MEEGRRCSCAACGPASFRDRRREAEFECDACDVRDGKFNLDDIDLYMRCQCGAKWGLGCLDRFQATIIDLFKSVTKSGDELDDPFKLSRTRTPRGAAGDARSSSLLRVLCLRMCFTDVAVFHEAVPQLNPELYPELSHWAWDSVVSRWIVGHPHPRRPAAWGADLSPRPGRKHVEVTPNSAASAKEATPGGRCGRALGGSLR